MTDLIKTCIPVTDLIRDTLTSLTLRRNAIAPEMDVITTLTTLTYLVCIMCVCARARARERESSVKQEKLRL